MKRAVFLLLILIAAMPVDTFSMGTIHLFADTTSLDISSDIAKYGTLNIWIAYSDLDNPELPCLIALEFMVEWNAPYLVEAGSPVFKDYVACTMGTIKTGISIALTREVYLWNDYVFFGYFAVLGLEDIITGSDPVVLSVVGDPISNYDNPIIARCDNVRSIYEVKGSRFVLPYEARVISTESISWGAIKSLLY